MNMTHILPLFKFYILFDIPILLKDTFIKGTFLVVVMMTFEFIGAFIGGHDLDTAIYWALNIIWPTTKVVVLLIFILGLILRIVSKINFLKIEVPIDLTNAKMLYDKWNNWKG